MAGNTVNISEELPFNIPKHWEWIKFEELFVLISGKDLTPSEYNDEGNGLPYITGASNFNNGNVSIVRWTPVPQIITENGDLLITCKGTVGEIAINNFGNAHIARQIMAIRNPFDFDIDFISLCIQFYVDRLKYAAKGLIPGISRVDILDLYIPIPPLQEQERISLKAKNLYEVLEKVEVSLK